MMAPILYRNAVVLEQDMSYQRVASRYNAHRNQFELDTFVWYFDAHTAIPDNDVARE